MTSPVIVEGETVVADGARIAWSHRRGPRPGAPRVALLHSLALDRSVWDGVLPHLADTAEVLALDCRGHGRSSTTGAPYSVEQFGDDLAAVFDQLGWSRAVVAGCSMGGCVAQAFAVRHAHRLAGLVLIDTTAWYGEAAPAQWAERAQTAREKGLAALAAFQMTRWVGDAFREHGRAVVERAMAVFLANDVEAYAASCRMLGAADLRERIGSIRVPTAVLVGAEDYATPPAMAAALRDAIPGATLAVIDGARHLTPLEVPERIAQAIRAVALHGASSSH